ncbi:hypothetical protein [Aureimonas altamirensis]|uniref:hypothetical protein n=1 Tax=Aureimonas altamirensis TaxID=370622 RepID=UPI000690E1E7|nr:hypothetical protein [Aureimonas altamirensis]
MFEIVDGERREMTQAEVDALRATLPEDSVTITTVFAVDLWSRMSDAEAEQVVEAMDTQPVRIRNIFRAANSYQSDHELWPLLVQVATALFGAERAAAILTPST